MKLPPRVRWLLRALAGLGAVLLLLGVVSYQLACHSAWGRERIRRLALAQLEPVLAGELELAELTRLGLSGLGLRGLTARDPGGARVLELEALELSWSLPALLGGAIEIERVELRGAQVDLADLSPQRGLLAALAPRVSEPTTSPAGPAPAVAVRAIAVDALSVSLEVPGQGVWGVRNLSLRGSYQQAEGRAAELSALSCELWRAGLPLGSIDAATAHYAGAGPSRLTLAARVAGSRLALQAEGRLPGDPEIGTAPLALSARLEHVGASTLAALGYAGQGSGWSQPLELELDVSGSVGAPRARFRLSAPSGALSGEAALGAERVAELRVSIEGLSLAEAYPGLPPGRLRGELGGTARLNEAPGIPVELRFTRGTLDESALPELTASARVFPERARELSLILSGYGGRAELRGEAEFSGQGRGSLQVSLPALERLPPLPGVPPLQGALELSSELEIGPGQLAARGQLGLERLLAAELSLGSLQTSFQITGDPEQPRLEAQLHATALQAGRVPVERASLQLDARRQAGAVSLALSAEGRAFAEPFQVSARRARVGADGSVEVQGFRAQALGQRLTLSGRYGQAGMQGLVLEAAGVDLARLSTAFGLEPALSGVVSLRARAQGRLEAPLLQLSLQGTAVKLGAVPALGLTLEAELDAARGRAQLTARGSAAQGRSLAIDARADFAPGPRPSWDQRRASARLDAELALENVDTELVNPWLTEPLPIGASADGRLRLRGSVREPELDAEIEARLVELRPGRDAALRLTAQYARGEARATLAVSDPDGPWLDGRAHLAHPDASTAAVLRDAPRLLALGAWDASVELAARRAAVLPFVPDVPGESEHLEVGGQLQLAHAPAAEPSGRLQLRLRRPRHATGECGAAASELDLRARIGSGRLEAELGVERKSERLARILARAGVELGALLQGAGPARLDGLELDATLDDVELSSLPYLCQRVHGRLRGTAVARNVLSPAPELRVALNAARLSLDRRQFVDARLDASVQLPRARLGLVLEHGGGRSSLDASVPLRVEGRRVVVPAREPLSAQLRIEHLPLGALVPPDAPLSRVSGSSSGRLELQGTREAPELRGYLELERVAFTATSLAQPLSDVAGRFVIEKNALQIERLSASDGDGTLTASGRLTLAPDARRLDADVSLVAKEFPMRQQGRVAGELDAALRVQLGLDAQAARVAIHLDDVSLWLRGGDLRQGIELEPHPDLIDPRARASSAAVAPASPASALPLELSLVSGDSIWVRREDFAAKLSAKLSASSKQGQLRMQGPVLLRRGYLQLLGKVFEIQDPSRIEFVGSDPPDPMLDITAVANTRGQGQRVRVEITGRSRSPELAFFVDDQAASAGEAAQALFAGGTAPGAATAQVQSFVGGLSSGLFALSARRELGEMMPILLVEPGTESSGSRVRAGFELDSLVPAFLRSLIRGVYVEGIIASGDGQQQQDTGGGVLLELYLPHDLVTSGQYGPGETWSLDLGWEP